MRGWLVVQFLFVAFYSLSAFSLVAKTCTEAYMRFTHFVDIQKNRPTRSEKNDAIESQLEFMFGAMANDDYKGVPRGEHNIDILGTEKIEPGKTRVHYSFAGPVLLQNGPRKYNSFPLPRDPTWKGIYEPSIDPKTGLSRATDPNDNGFDDMWYYFDPTHRGSRLKEGVHYDQVKATIDRVRNTTRTMPEYERLKDTNGNIRISVFFGMDDGEHSRDANRSKDLSAIGYRSFRDGLVALGFEGEKMSNEEMTKILKGRRFQRPFVETFEKMTPQGKISINVFYGPTASDEPSGAFHYFYKDALEKSSVMIYDGHSGLGSYLDLDDMQSTEGFRIKKDPKKYQILFFNSCSSYSYYNIAYHVLKGGRNPTKSLDILSNGLATSFDLDQKTNLVLIRAIDQWALHGTKKTYRALAKDMDTANLFAVSGDEDNPKKR